MSDLKQSYFLFYGICICLFLFGFYKLTFFFFVLFISVVYPDEDHTREEIDEMLEIKVQYDIGHSVVEISEFELIPEDLVDILETIHIDNPIKKHDGLESYNKSLKNEFSSYFKQKKNSNLFLKDNIDLKKDEFLEYKNSLTDNKKLNSFLSTDKKKYYYQGIYSFSEYDYHLFKTKYLSNYKKKVKALNYSNNTILY